MSVLVESDGAFDFLVFDCFFCFLAMVCFELVNFNSELEVISLMDQREGN